MLPAAAPLPLWQQAVDIAAGIAGAICTHIYLSYVFVKSRSILVVSLAHIAMNNASRSFAYFAVIQNQFTANLAKNIAMLLVLGVLYYSRELRVLVAAPATSTAGALELS